MNHVPRRTVLKSVACACGGAAASLVASPAVRALADSPKTQTEFFVFILAAGGWDVTIWSDPRNQQQGLVNPGDTQNTMVARAPRQDLWTNAPLDGDKQTFEILSKGNFQLGPGIGDLIDYTDRLTLINGLAMNTVSHPDGKAFSCTGRHLAGGHAAASSIDTMVANELGATQLLPNVSILFPSAIIGSQLDPRAAPLLVDQVGTMGKSLSRSSLYESAAERDLVTAALSAEATDLSAIANDPSALDAMALQYGSLKKMLDPSVLPTFNAKSLMSAMPAVFDWTLPDGKTQYRPRFQGDSLTDAAFAVQAMKLNLVRCVSFTLQGFDTHNANYQFHLQTLQEGMHVIAKLIDALDRAPHPTIATDKLSEHTHILVVSDFCRTPQINLAGGRDHYPNNSAIVVSPKFKAGTTFGSTDPDQLLPADGMGFADGPRPIGPPDLLRTFVSAFGIDPSKYIRDGQVVPQLLVGS